jgi:hypothetical protein
VHSRVIGARSFREDRHAPERLGEPIRLASFPLLREVLYRLVLYGHQPPL